MSKHVKPGGNQPQSKPHKNRTHEYKTEISGGVFVRGEIVSNVPPSEVKKSDSAREREEARENKRYLIEKITLGPVILYGAVTAWMAISSQKIADLTRNQFIQTRGRGFRLMFPPIARRMPYRSK